MNFDLVFWTSLRPCDIKIFYIKTMLGHYLHTILKLGEVISLIYL